VIGASRLADLHAYVDDCLEPDERLAFEERMAEDPALARRATMWRAQNSAIRSAFDGEGPKAFSISMIRHQSEVPARSRWPAPAGERLVREGPLRASSTGLADASRIVANVGAAPASRPRLAWRYALAAVLLCLVTIWSPAAQVIPAEGLGAAAVAAFRAFVRPGVQPVEFVTGGKGEAEEWLTSRLLRPVYLPPTPPALNLLGARMAPYPSSPAAFLVYGAREGRVGLLVRPLDAPVTKAPELLAVDGHDSAVWTWGGQGFALVGDLNALSLLKIAQDLFGLPTEAVQPMSERGS
jgi:anti-sigma factor RsiW